MTSSKTLLCVLVVSLCLAGCKDNAATVAKVNGRDITQAEFDAYLKLKHISAADVKRRSATLDEYLERSALATILEKEGKLDKLAIDAEVEEFRKELVISRYFDQFLGEKVSEAALKNYYDAHAATYEQRKVHVAHILVRTQSRMSEPEKQAKRTTVQEIYSKLQAGEPFEELAKTASEDRISGAKGGDLGWLREGSIDPEFSKRAFSSKAGSVSEPFETAFGFHILKVIEEPKVARKPFGAAVGDIRYQLRSEAKAAEVERLKGLAKIEKLGAYQTSATVAASASASAQPLPPPVQPKYLPPTESPPEPALGIPQPSANLANPVEAAAPGRLPTIVERTSRQAAVPAAVQNNAASKKIPVKAPKAAVVAKPAVGRPAPAQNPH